MTVKSGNIELKLQTLPEKPGVYQFFDEQDLILYVGKAKNLKKRVNSYFSKQHQDGKTVVLVKKIRDVKHMVVDSELDALLLENNLIKKYQPKYNIQLKDDKTYPWICIKNEPFPRVFSTRRLIRDGSKYFGPYPSGKVMHTLLQLIRELYPLRSCHLDLSEQKIKQGKHKVCLEFHLGNCLGPCEGHQQMGSYDEQIAQIQLLLKGNIASVIRLLKDRMAEQAKNLEFESAQETKEKIQSLENYQSKSTIVSPTIHEVDVITVEDDEDRAYFNYLCIHNGSIVHAYTAEVRKKLHESVSDMIGYILPEMRERYESSSKEILIEQPLDFEIAGLKFSIPQRGDKKQLIDLSRRNARFYKLERAKQEKIKDPERHTKRILDQIQKDFRLKDLPIHMECFDNSNIQGTNPVSACVVFRDAKPSKKDYRHFNVKTVEGPDDFASMKEAVFRRYRRLLDEEQALPQLIIIDGGKGQLNSALEALDELGIRGKVAIIGIAKRLEEIFFPGDSLPIYLDKRSESLKVIQFMRNEAHRFGITHHRNKRSKTAITSTLLEIQGIGPKTQELLMKQFKTVSAVRKASMEELAKVVGEAKAKTIKNQLK